MTDRISSTPRRDGRRLGRLSGPPLIVQLIGLLVGALVAAQLVTLLLTLIIPPGAPREYALADIAEALRGSATDRGRFDRVIQSGPPEVAARGWFVSDTARARLASLMDRPVHDIALGFFTQLPVGGAVDPVATPERLPDDAKRLRTPPLSQTDPVWQDDASLVLPVAFDTAGAQPQPTAAVLFQQMPGGPPGGGFPGGGPPGGGFPGNGSPGGGFPRPDGRQPQDWPQRQPQSQLPQRQQQPQAQVPTQSQPRPQNVPSGQPQTPSQAQASTPQSAQQGQPQNRTPFPTVPRGQTPDAQPGTNQSPGTNHPGGGGQRPGTPGAMPGLPVPPVRSAQPLLPAVPVPAPDLPEASPATIAPTGRDEPAGASAERVEVRREAAPIASPPPAAPRPAEDGSTAVPPPTDGPRFPIERPVPIVRPPNSLFGLATAPFVEGDFVAGVRLADGRWAVVSPRAEGFPNAWQRRVALWFLLSLLAVAPVAWLFARRIVGPLNEFARAADILGRDPLTAVLPLHGSAEIGRAAHAFNQMQSRLRSFVDDRTAMLGAISHDLRTPLTRLRFRIEDVPEDQQDDLRGEVAEMEEMISSVIAFMRDASTPNARERRDLAEIVDDVIEDATLLGDVRAMRVESAIVDIDPLGVRRVLNNLLTNAIKYGGGHVRVALTIDRNCAVADIVDDGPGVDDADIERIFEPFYRSEAARRSDRDGSGLGLAVCRSIARAHGGDVALFRSADGFTARVTLPLAFSDDRRVA